MTKFEYSTDGLWYTKSHKGEHVTHLFRLGTTIHSICNGTHSRDYLIKTEVTNETKEV